MSGGTGDLPVVCFPFAGDLVGGSHISALGLVKRIDRQRYRPLVLLQETGGAIAALFAREGIAVEAAPRAVDLEHGKRLGLRSAWRILMRLPALTRFLRTHNVAIVHTNDGRSHAIWSLAARFAGAKLVWHHRSHPRALGVRLVAPWLAHRILSVSRFAAPPLGWGPAPAHRPRVIHSPFVVDRSVDRDVARARLLAELECPPETRLIGFFGALIDRKRPLLFIDTIAAIRRSAPGFPVRGLLFGEGAGGADVPVMRHACDLGVGDAISLMGFRYPAEPWIAACDLLLVSAIDEPFGRTLIEAMLLGTPVVATASGGNVEAIEHGVTGLLATPENAEALASTCLEMLTSPDTDAIVAKAHIWADSRFDPDRHSAEVMQVYDQILGRRPPMPTGEISANRAMTPS